MGIILSHKSIREDGVAQVIGFGMLLGGALGNLVDRVKLDGVVDFLDFRVWPIFNFADTFICIGVGILLVSSLADPIEALISLRDRH